jgi:ketosteroid isomerase-like protein
MSTAETFEQAIESSRRALDEIARGNPDAFLELYSRWDDATLANPYGPPACGFCQIEAAGRRAAGNYRDGRAVEFETFAKFHTGDLGYTLEIERFETKVAGGDEISPVALRVTSVFRWEDAAWRLLHRHGDPITSPRSGDSVIQTWHTRRESLSGKRRRPADHAA